MEAIEILTALIRVRALTLKCMISISLANTFWDSWKRWYTCKCQPVGPAEISRHSRQNGNIMCSSI